MKYYVSNDLLLYIFIFPIVTKFYSYFNVQEFDEIMKQIIMLKEKVRQMLVPNENVTNPSREANLIDSIQRLGLYHHFEQEIGELLRHIDNNHVENGTITLNEDLHSIALVFRLLRQQGYHILPGKPHLVYLY